MQETTEAEGYMIISERKSNQKSLKVNDKSIYSRSNVMINYISYNFNRLFSFPTKSHLKFQKILFEGLVNHDGKQ